MQLIKSNPVNNMFGMGRHMASLLDDFFYADRKSGQGEGHWKWNPAVDIFEEGDTIVVKAEIPGMVRDDISVEVKDRVLTLKGERTAEETVENGGYLRRERTYGRFERAFTLPSDVKAEDIQASYSDGVLKVVVPKPETSKPKQISIH
jgi:HSP20 family protein